MDEFGLLSADEVVYEVEPCLVEYQYPEAARGLDGHVKEKKQEIKGMMVGTVQVRVEGKESVFQAFAQRSREILEILEIQMHEEILE